MIVIPIADPTFTPAYLNAYRAMPKIELERPRQYFQRWHEEYRCRVIGDVVEFKNEEDYTWFMLRWS